MLSEQLRKLRRRVVVTGVGAVTPVGLTFDATWDAFLAGRSGVAQISTFDTDDLPTSIAGQIKDFDPAPYLPRSVARRMDSYAQYAMAAALQAQQSAKLTIDESNADRVGVLIGSGYGAVNSIDEFSVTIRRKGPRAISPFAPITGAIDSAAGEISMALTARGPSRAISSACATGTDALGEAARWIQFGMADAVVVGGADNCVTRVDLAGSGNARALSRRTDAPEEASRPFDEDRDGFVMSAGAGVLVLEDAERAEQRGATILAEVLGYGCSSDAYHWTAPQPEGLGAKRAMRAALADAGIRPEQVDHVNAHGTGTKLNDASEVASLREVLGERATRIPVCSIKSMTGHMIGAAGAVEAITAVRTIRTGIVPPTINCHRPLDPEFNFVPGEPQTHDVRVAMSNSFGFGGHNAVVVLGAWER
ncbi:beta-ketoacyl-ACP synthase II [Saccharopolyspora cebuensis]|uniref:3-oxoacyl-[acyl-carrier-protein] synthase 2 n=1 Tax=Saccharopolyspora cebuensis TaxID=418759 RepID=A0ABV4CIL6_9PSEU